MSLPKLPVLNNDGPAYKDSASGRSLRSLLSPKSKSKGSALGINNSGEVRGAASPPLSPSSGAQKKSQMAHLHDYTEMMEFMWNGEATSVAIKASWCELPSQLIPLETLSKQYHVVNTEVPAGKHKYYFIVDGHKKLDPRGVVNQGEKVTNQLIIVDPKKYAAREAKKAGLFVGDR